MAQTAVGPMVNSRVPFIDAEVSPEIPGLSNYYWLQMYTTYSHLSEIDLVCLDMVAGTTRVTVGPLGRPTNGGFQFHPASGLMYFSTYRSNTYPSPLCSYNFLTGAYEDFGYMPTYRDNYGNTVYDAAGFLICSEETPSRVFYGSIDGRSGQLTAWEPVGRTQQDFGILDDPGGYCNFTADPATNQLTVSVKYWDGRAVWLAKASGAAFPTVVGDALAVGTTYYLHYIDDTHVGIARTRALALAGTCIDLTDAGSGTLTINPVYNRYIKSLQVDANYAYCCIWDDETNASGIGLKYLCIVPLAGGAPTLYWKTTGLTSLWLRRGVTHPENIYACVAPAIGGDSYFLLDGINAPTGAAEPAGGLMTMQTAPPTVTSMGVYTKDETLKYTGMYAPTDPTDKHVQLGYKVSGGASTFVTAELTSLTDFPVQRGGLDLDNNLIVHSVDYAGMAKYDRVTGDISTIPTTVNLEGYSIEADPHMERVWLGGYAQGMFFEYDPATGFSATNPLRRLFNSEGHTAAKYHYQIERMVDGSVWAIGNYTRQPGYWGEIIRYDPVLETNTRVEGALIEAYGIYNAAPNIARSLLVVSTEKIVDASRNLFVISALRQNSSADANHGIIKDIPLPAVAATAFYQVVSVETGAADINRFVCIRKSVSPYRAYCINIATGQLVWDTGDIVGSPYLTPYTKPQFAYGYVWFFDGLNVMKMNALTGAVTNAQIGGVNIALADGTASQLRGLVWDTTNKILYMWDTYNKQVYRVEGIDGI